MQQLKWEFMVPTSRGWWRNCHRGNQSLTRAKSSPIVFGDFREKLSLLRYTVGVRLKRADIEFEKTFDNFHLGQAQPG
jgi:hypothetical protein